MAGLAALTTGEKEMLHRKRTHTQTNRHTQAHTMSRTSPVIVSVAESSYWDLKCLPHRVQSVLHHLGLMADGEPEGNTHTHTHTHISFKDEDGEHPRSKVS